MARPARTLLALLGMGSVLASATSAPEPTAPALMPRDGCPASMFQCATSLGAVFSNVCCANGQTCALDSNNDPACCPSGAVCTGTAPTGNPTPGATYVVSYVPNSYFSFPYAMTTFDSSGACRSAKSACSDNYDLCTENLGGGSGGNYAVTIQVPGGGGVTVGSTASDLGTSATSICSSLSSEACSPLEATQCSSFGSIGSLEVSIPPTNLGLGAFMIWAAVVLLG